MRIIPAVHATCMVVAILAGSAAGTAIWAAEGPGEGGAPTRRPDAAPAPAPSDGSAAPCGAVAYTADGAFGGAFGMSNCDEAHRLAVDECVKVSTDKKDCSEGVVSRRDSWFHIQFCQRDRNWTTQVTTRATLGETNSAASEWARTSKFGSEYCRLVPNGLFHSGGLHTKL